MPVEIVIDAGVSLTPGATARIQSAYDAVARRLACTTAQVCLRVCQAAESQALNAQFRSQDKPTNVLSFPAEIEVEGVQILGDICLCWPIVEAEAAAQSKSVLDHATHLTIHGMLHLQGYDHQHDAEAEHMEQLEREILAVLGIADPYS